MRRGRARFSPRPARNRTLDARLAALLVEVRIQGEPADAEVFVNGNSRGKAPASLQLPASRHHIEVRKEGFNPFITDLVLAPGIARTLEFKLVNPKDVAGNSPQRITTKSGIRLLIVAGGTYQAGTDRREQGRRPNEGAHKVTLLRPFYMGERESHQRAVPPVPARLTTRAPSATSRSTSTSNPCRASPGKKPPSSATGCRRRKACRLPTKPSEGGELLAHRAGDQRISPAHRGRVGVRGARRRHRQAAQVSLGPGSARGLRHRELRRQRGARVVRRRARRPPGRIPGRGRAGAVPAERAGLLRLRRQRVRVGQRPISVVRALRRAVTDPLGPDRRQGPRLSRLQLALGRPPSSCASRGAKAPPKPATSSDSASRVTCAPE